MRYCLNNNRKVELDLSRETRVLENQEAHQLKLHQPLPVTGALGVIGLSGRSSWLKGQKGGVETGRNRSNPPP